MKILILFLQLFILTSFSQTGNLVFESFLKNEQVKRANVAFQVYNLTQQKGELNYNENKLLVPASLQKLITTSTALNILGNDFIFNTKVNFIGEINANNFKGIIEVIASGDPSLNEDFLSDILQQLKAKGINTFEGHIVVKENIFDRQAPMSWLVEDVANYYGTPAFSFNYLKNTFKLTFEQTTEGKTPKIKSISLKRKDLKFDNQIITAGKNTGDNAYFIGLPFSNDRQLVGSIPEGTGYFTIKGADNNPSKTFKSDLLDKLKDNGVSFLYNSNITMKNLVFTYSHKSKSLAELVKETNQKSINLYAEALLKMIGYKKYGFGTSENGIKAIKEPYNNEDLIFYDGSGLSRKDLIFSSFLQEVLISNKDNEAFKNSLGVSGVSGTMKYFNSTLIKGKVKAKSGSADGILNYAGYFTNSKGEELVFVFMINSYTGKRTVLRKAMVKVIEGFL